MNHLPTRAFAKTILMNPFSFEWTIQGLGMLRMYVGGDKFRLHVWDSDYRTPHVSTLHTHPWDFTSYVLAGRIDQCRFTETGGEPYYKQAILCGAGGKTVGEPCPVRLTATAMETYCEGQSYAQKAAEIHDSFPLPGTVTLIERTFYQDTEGATVYWPEGHTWGSSAARMATRKEVATITQRALARWF